jgi:hypothetical protein
MKTSSEKENLISFLSKKILEKEINAEIYFNENKLIVQFYDKVLLFRLLTIGNTCKYKEFSSNLFAKSELTSIQHKLMQFFNLEVHTHNNYLKDCGIEEVLVCIADHLIFSKNLFTDSGFVFNSLNTEILSEAPLRENGVYVSYMYADINSYTRMEISVIIKFEGNDVYIKSLDRKYFSSDLIFSKILNDDNVDTGILIIDNNEPISKINIFCGVEEDYILYEGFAYKDYLTLKLNHYETENDTPKLIRNLSNTKLFKFLPTN